MPRRGRDAYYRMVSSGDVSRARGSARRGAPPRLGPPASELSARGRELLDELETIFVAEGFAHFTVGDLAARLRCSRRTLYELAPSKDELVLVVIDRRLRRFGRIAQERAAGIEDPFERIEAFLHVGPSEVKRTTVRLLEDIAAFPAARRLVADHYHHTTAVLGELLQEGQATGAFRPLRAGLVSEMLDAALDRLQDPELLRAEGVSYEQAVAELVALLRSGITRQRSAGSSAAKRRARKPAVPAA